MHPPSRCIQMPSCTSLVHAWTFAACSKLRLATCLTPRSSPEPVSGISIVRDHGVHFPKPTLSATDWPATNFGVGSFSTKRRRLQLLALQHKLFLDSENPENGNAARNCLADGLSQESKMVVGNTIKTSAFLRWSSENM